MYPKSKTAVAILGDGFCTTAFIPSSSSALFTRARDVQTGLPGESEWRGALFTRPCSRAPRARDVQGFVGHRTGARMMRLHSRRSRCRRLLRRSRSGSRRRLLLRQLPGSPELPRFRRAHVRRRRAWESTSGAWRSLSKRILACIRSRTPPFCYPRLRPRYFLFNAWCARPINLLSASLALRLRRARAAQHATLSPTQRVLRLRPPRARRDPLSARSGVRALTPLCRGPRTGELPCA